jgi:hypothetical protein
VVGAGNFASVKEMIGMLDVSSSCEEDCNGNSVWLQEINVHAIQWLFISQDQTISPESNFVSFAIDFYIDQKIYKKAVKQNIIPYNLTNSAWRKIFSFSVVFLLDTG